MSPPEATTPHHRSSMIERVLIRQATAADADAIVETLAEAARWVGDLDGTVMWVEGELEDERVRQEAATGMFVVGEVDGRVAGAMRFQLEDPLFWPDLNAADSAFVHRLAVKRAFAGRRISTALLEWAVDRARTLGRRYLRLDCDAERSRLRAFYERFGFRLHSYRQVGSYYVSRYELKILQP